jgi:hypothetical protein
VEIEVRVSLIELKRAFGRLLARLPDDSEAGGDFIVFNASARIWPWSQEQLRMS